MDSVIFTVDDFRSPDDFLHQRGVPGVCVCGNYRAAFYFQTGGRVWLTVTMERSWEGEKGQSAGRSEEREQRRKSYVWDAILAKKLQFFRFICNSIQKATVSILIKTNGDFLEKNTFHVKQRVTWEPCRLLTEIYDSLCKKKTAFHMWWSHTVKSLILKIWILIK